MSGSENLPSLTSQPRRRESSRDRRRSVRAVRGNSPHQRGVHAPPASARRSVSCLLSGARPAVRETSLPFVVIFGRARRAEALKRVWE